MPAKKQALGRGFDALFPKKELPPKTGTAREVLELEIDKIKPNPYQPRTQFDDSAISDLAQSIKEKGVVQPILVCPQDDEYILVAGERRLRASKMALLTHIPAIITYYDNSEMLQIALIENIQREGLNPIDEAYAYHQLIKEFGLKQEEIAQRVGKNRATIANTLRLLNLSQEIQQDIVEGRLTAGHARAILSLNESREQSLIREKIITGNLSVRQAEELAILMKEPKQKKKKKKQEKADSDVVNIEQQLIDALCTKVKIKQTANNKGKVEIYYNTIDDLDRLFSLLGINLD